MKSWQIICLCFLATALLCVSKSFITSSTSISTSSLIFLPQRRLMSSSSFVQQEEYQRIKEGEMKSIRRMEGSFSIQRELYRRDEEDSEEVIYHIDYQGVMTHPTPTPKHPKP